MRKLISISEDEAIMLRQALGLLSCSIAADMNNPYFISSDETEQSMLNDLDQVDNLQKRIKKAFYFKQ